jgi:hypothetical protein
LKKDVFFGADLFMKEASLDLNLVFNDFSFRSIYREFSLDLSFLDVAIYISSVCIPNYFLY